jgi:hypothetical protein
MITKGRHGFKHLSFAWHGSLWLLTAWKISVLRINNRLVIYWDYKGEISFHRH